MAFWPKVYKPLGFRNGLDFALFLVPCSGLMGFVIWRSTYYNFDAFLMSTIPSSAATYAKPGTIRLSIITHLVSILPAGFLAVFQFVPVVRRRFHRFHAVNGYLILSLYLISLAGSVPLIPSSAGGSPATQAILALLAVISTVSMYLGYYNIKRGRIDLHREWMIRAWAYAGCVVTERPILIASIVALQLFPGEGRYDVQPCSIIVDQWALYGVPPETNTTQKLYPACVDLNARTIVDVAHPQQGPETISAAVHLTFGMSLWVALAVHAICVETYFRFSKAARQRPRIVDEQGRDSKGSSLHQKDDKND